MDNKYGRIFTQDDVRMILERYDPEFSDGEFGDSDENLADLLRDMDASGVRFKFEPDEPLFVFRGHDKRAAGGIRHYRDHQSPNAPRNHVYAIEAALRAFDDYRQANPGKMREPD